LDPLNNLVVISDIHTGCRVGLMPAEVPGVEPRGIYVDPELSPKSFLETAIHEAMHAEDKDITEAVINRRASSMARWLWRLWYRRGK